MESNARQGYSASDMKASTIQSICRYIESNAAASLSLADLSRRAGLSLYHFQRRFKAEVGISPKQYQEACRMGDFKKRLQAGGAVTGAIFDAGFGSLSRVYEKSAANLGMTPREYRAGGRDLEIHYATAKTPLGLMMIAATDRGLCSVKFGETEDTLTDSLRTEYPSASIHPMKRPYPEQFKLWMESLNAYLRGKGANLNLPVDIRATAFQSKVWRYLQTIPAGQVRSYTQVAREIGQPKAVRAVARACASNAVAIVVPCHRVIRESGDLAGYRWGIERKKALLQLEKADVSPAGVYHGNKPHDPRNDPGRPHF